MAAENVTIFRTVLRIPWHILLVAGVLVTIGALALYSASEGSWTCLLYTSDAADDL